MIQSSTCPEPVFKPGDRFLDFEITRVEPLPDVRQTAYEIRHLRTGAGILHLHNDDPENLYAICFRTPPGDSTGLPHILEHSVLAGSERYPLKDVFNELHRGSLQTFINAFTYPDKTVYPVASQVRKDFFNLARVYTDLVLRPRLLRETFLQEGHHFEFADPGNPDSELVISGIVYNEMKGAYSSPDSLMFKAIQENLYPDTIYRNDSGGAPDIIPSLTYEQFRAFHRSFYSPSNARFFFYGDTPTRDCLAFLGEVLDGFDAVAVESRIVGQERWTAPRSVSGEYPVGADEDTAAKTAVNVAWMLTDNLDYETVILLEIVSWALVGSAAGPLRKALVESGLGEDLSPVTGLEKDLKQPAFAVGLRGTEPGRAEAIESLILDTVTRLVESGFERDLIEGALHQVEFHGKEISRGAYPYGITLMGRVFHTWLYDGDPLAGLNFPALIEDIRRRWDRDPALFQEVLRRWFLENPHRLLSVMKPSATYQQQQEARSREALRTIAAGLSPEDRKRIASDALRLKRFQTEPDPPGAKDLLPAIGIGDLSSDVDIIPVESESRRGVTVLSHDLFTNDIAYLQLAFDVAHVPDELQPYLPLLCKLMTGLGAGALSYDELSKRIALKTGGLGAHLASGFRIGGRETWQKMIFHVRMLYRNIPDAVGILSDILFRGNLTETARIRDLVFEGRNDLQAAVVPSGHLFAKRTAAASLTLPAYREEQWNGRSQLKFIHALTESWDETLEDFINRIGDLKAMIVRKDGLLANLTADGQGLRLLSEAIEPVMARMSESPSAVCDVPVPVLPSRMGVVIPAQVSYVAEAFPAPTYGSPLAAPLFVLSRLLSNGCLYQKIRVQGGAYGGMCQYDPTNGLFAFLSYRDPHLERTLAVYEEALRFAEDGGIPAEEIRKAVIGSIGALDRPTDPAGRGFTSMIRHFAGLTDEERRRFRQAVLAMGNRELTEGALKYLAGVRNRAAVAVYSEAEKMNRANETLRPPLRIEPLM
ncbi:MAG TPA: insulinase family protein [Syntrophales bacterium]|nr:insulinase family protein [Syntrophales bacterium]HQA81823.1 insulinase family protein [Syntrophales bacterium]